MMFLRVKNYIIVKHPEWLNKESGVKTFLKEGFGKSSYGIETKNYILFFLVSLLIYTLLKNEYHHKLLPYQSYFYSIELVDDQWQPVQMSPFDYTNGFSQNKINLFNVSSIALQKCSSGSLQFVHYVLN